MNDASSLPSRFGAAPVRAVGRELRRTFFLDMPWRIPAYALLMVAGSLLYTGYRVYVGNQAHQIPVVQLMADRALYPNDPYAATLPLYCSLLWRGVAWASRLVPLEGLLLALYIVERVFQVFAAGGLARALSRDSEAAVVGAMLFMAVAPNAFLGSGRIMAPYVEQTAFSIPFFLLAAAALYRRAPAAWAAWFAIGFSLNSMYGTYAMTYYGAAFLFDADCRREWRAWLRGLGLFLLLASPAILLTMSAIGQGSADRGLWLALARARFPHHLFPLDWPMRGYVLFGLLAAVLLGILLANRRHRPRLLRHGVAWTAAGVLWIAYAFFAAYAARAPWMLVMHPGRGTDLWVAFAAVAIIAAAGWRLERDASRESALLAVLVALVLAVCCKDAGGYWFAAAGAALIAAAATPFIRRAASGPRGGARLAFALALCAVATTVPPSVHRAIDRRSLLGSPLYAGSRGDVEAVARWARTSTPATAVFLVPVLAEEWAQFRGLSLRPVFVTWSDASAMLWARGYAGEWVARVRALGWDPLAGSQAMEGPGRRVTRHGINVAYDRLSDPRVRELAAQYGVRYWVVRLEKVSSMPVVFQGDKMKVLDAAAAPAEPAPSS